MKARIALLFAVVLVIAALGPVLYAVALVVGQVGVSVLAGSWVPLPLTLVFADHAALQGGKAAPLLAFVPELRWEGHRAMAWLLDRVHVAAVFAIIGLAVVPLGLRSVRWNMAMIRAEKQWKEDRLRRVEDYRRDGGPAGAPWSRREPFIGSGIEGRHDRRVA